MSTNHCIVYWSGPKTRLEVYPLQTNLMKKLNINPNNAQLNDIVALLDGLSEQDWDLRSSMATKGNFVWTLER